MKFWLCFCLCSWLTVWGMAQQVDGAGTRRGDDCLLQEFEAMCHRHVGLKRQAAEQMHLDTLPFIQEKLEDYRWQLVYQLVHPHSEHPKRMLQVKILQVFKNLSQNISASRLRKTEQWMDSLYSAIQHGADFEACVQQFSDDKSVHWLASLEAPIELEEQAFRLEAGDISKPFYSPLGIHLLKVLEKKEIQVGQPKEVRHCLQWSDENSSLGWLDELKQKYSFTPHRVAIQQVLKNKNTSQVLFTLQGEEYTGNDFLLFARSFPAAPKVQFEAFLMKSLLDRTLHGLPQDFPEAYAAFQSYRDSLLVCELTKLQLAKDGVGEEEYWRTYYDQHRSDYQFKMSKYQGVVIQATSKRVAKQVRKFLKKLPFSEWKEAVRLTFAARQHPEVKVEEGVFLLGDHPWVDYRIFKQKKPIGLSDYPAVLVMGRKIKSPLSFEEVREEVMRDCLQAWEKQWISRLRRNN